MLIFLVYSLFANIAIPYLKVHDKLLDMFIYHSISTIPQFTPTKLTIIKSGLKSDVRYVSYLCILAYNMRMVDFHYKVFSKIIQNKILVRMLYNMTIFSKVRILTLWPQGPQWGMPIYGERMSKKIAPGHFSNPTFLISVQTKFQLSIKICRFTSKIPTLATSLINFNSIHEQNSCFGVSF